MTRAQQHLIILVTARFAAKKSPTALPHQEIRLDRSEAIGPIKIVKDIGVDRILSAIMTVYGNQVDNDFVNRQRLLNIFKTRSNAEDMLKRIWIKHKLVKAVQRSGKGGVQIMFDLGAILAPGMSRLSIDVNPNALRKNRPLTRFRRRPVVFIDRVVSSSVSWHGIPANQGNHCSNSDLVAYTSGMPRQSTRPSNL
jgi:hypothetical protein